jgi:hypothetical protein
MSFESNGLTNQVDVVKQGLLLKVNNPWFLSLH